MHHKTAPQVVVLAMCDTWDRFIAGLVVPVIHRLEPPLRAPLPEAALSREDSWREAHPRNRGILSAFDGRRRNHK
jgi:hypothetical protein